MKGDKKNNRVYRLRTKDDFLHSFFFIKWMLNLDHIRDAIPFPRMINRVYP